MHIIERGEIIFHFLFVVVVVLVLVIIVTYIINNKSEMGTRGNKGVAAVTLLSKRGG